MNYYRVRYKKNAEKFIKTNKIIGIKFFQAFTEISQDFLSCYKKYDIKKLKGYDDFFRLRIGKYRAVFRVKNQELILLVIEIDSRGDIYKGM